MVKRRIDAFLRDWLGHLEVCAQCQLFDNNTLPPGLRRRTPCEIGSILISETALLLKSFIG